MKKLIAISLILICNLAFAEPISDILQVALPTSALTISYAKKDIEGVKQFIPSYAVGMGTSHALKLADLSSGHTTSAFVSAEYLRKRYGLLYGIPAYALAGTTGYMRVDAGKHEWYEVLVGGGIGITSAYLFTDNISLEPYECGAVVRLRW